MYLTQSGYVITTVQTFLVSGGYSSSIGYLKSTELLVETASSWVFTGDLPSSRPAPRATNIDNKILMTGNCVVTWEIIKYRDTPHLKVRIFQTFGLWFINIINI